MSKRHYDYIFSLHKRKQIKSIRIATMERKINSSQLNPHVSVDCVIFGYNNGELKVLLIERKTELEEKALASKSSHSDTALPGNLIRDDEDLDFSAKRVLKELTGLDNIYLEQFYTFGNHQQESPS